MSPDQPIAGHYRLQLAPGAPWSPCRFWFGPPADPDTGELLDRSPRWQAEVRGELWAGNIVKLWQYACNHPIPEPTCRYMVAIARHATEHEPDMPEAAPKTAINLNSIKPIF